jgi:hypothetical protein
VYENPGSTISLIVGQQMQIVEPRVTPGTPWATAMTRDPLITLPHSFVSDGEHPDHQREERGGASAKAC